MKEEPKKTMAELLNIKELERCVIFHLNLFGIIILN